MADKLYTVIDGIPSELDLGSGGGSGEVLPGIDERVTALEASQIEQDEAIEETGAQIISLEASLRALVDEEKMALQSQVEKAMPAGTVIAFAANSNPEGFLVCNGAAVSRNTYLKLFEAIGTIYGAGDGTTTFNIPDLRGRYIEGQNDSPVGTYKEAGLPNIRGSISHLVSTTDEGGAKQDGAFSWNEKEGVGKLYVNGGRAWKYDPQFDASASNGIYGRSGTVQPAAVTMSYYIKY